MAEEHEYHEETKSLSGKMMVSDETLAPFDIRARESSVEPDKKAAEQ